MDLFRLFYLALKCIELLAWPSFALGYPLLPLWPHAKILAIFWLVIPGFDGANIAYNNLGESFLVVAQRYVDEHGAEALEKLITHKTKYIEPKFSQDDIKAVESVNGSAESEENKTTEKLKASVEVKNMTFPSPLEENVQREYACAVCQVTTSSKATLNSHLLGRKHRIKTDELKAGKQITKKGGVTVGGPNRVRNCTICQVKTQSEETWNSHVQSKKHKSECKELKAIVKEVKSYHANQDPNKEFSDVGPSNKINCANTSSDGGLNHRFGCDQCQVKLQSEATLKSHLHGKKHKSKSEELKSREISEKEPNESLGAIITSSAPQADEKNESLNNSDGQINNKPR